MSENDYLLINNLFRENLAASVVQLEDQSHHHQGHQGVKFTGGGHYAVIVVSEQFRGKGLLERHRMVYAAVAEVKEKIHALAIKAYTPEEYAKKEVS